MSLRARVLVGVAVIAVVLVATAAAVTRTTRANLVRQVDDQLAAATAGPLRGIQIGPRPVDRDPGGPPRISTFYLGYVGPAGRLQTIAAPNVSSEGAPVPDLDAARAVALAATGETVTTGSEGSDVRYRVRALPERRTGGVVVLGLPLDTVDDAVDRLVAVEALATAAILAVLAAVAWWVVHLGVRPVKRMTAVAGAIAAGDLSSRVPELDRRTEAGQLGAALNQMLARIQVAFEERRRSEERLRQFVADASHELRTPVATIRGYAELHRSGGLTEPDALADAMRRTEQEAARMASLVEDLLELARLDRSRPLAAAPVDLAGVAADAAADARARDPHRPVDVVVEDRVVVRADEERLRQVVANLVGNVSVHTPPDAALHLTVRREGGRGVVVVRDEGPGMPDEVAARAFERFFRGDPSRARHRGGTGLGLSIVEATVAAMEGEVSLESAPGEGTAVAVALPEWPGTATGG